MAARIHDPDAVQMSFGEHLEELRRRLIYAIIGVFVVSLGTCYYGRDIVDWLCEPLLEVERAAKLPLGLYTSSPLTSFTADMKVVLVSALIISAPWVIYQFWKFVAAGLYPAERRIFVLMAPVSALLTALSVVFLYYVMLPAMLAFLIQFSITYPAHTGGGHGFLQWITHKFMGANEAMSSMGPDLVRHHTPAAGVPAGTQPANLVTAVQQLTADPSNPADGQLWLNTSDGQLKVFLDGLTRNITLNSGSLMTPLTDIDEYLNLVMGTALVMVATFQIPVVMGALAAGGLVDPKFLARYRKYVFVGVFVLGLFITPSQDVFSDVAIPLLMYGLFEVGLLLMRLLWKQPEEMSVP